MTKRTPEQTLAQLDVIEREATQRRNVGKYVTNFEQFVAECAVPDLVALVRAQRDEITYLHTVTQGLRCERDDLRAKYADALTVIRGLDVVRDAGVVGARDCATDQAVLDAFERIRAEITP